MLAACAARRWLARNAAGVKRIHSRAYMEASAHTSLVSCLPALERVVLCLEPLRRDELACLLEALAWCPRLRQLDLTIEYDHGKNEQGEDVQGPFPDASAFAKLSSLTQLSLAFNEGTLHTLARFVGALVPLTGLAELVIGLRQSAVVPAALGQLKGLRSLELYNMQPCVLEAGCLVLPLLERLNFISCNFEGAEVLPGVTALQCLTSLAFSMHQGVCFFDPELVQLPRLARLVMSMDFPDEDDEDEECSGDPPGLLRLPADMGLLSLSLVDLDLSGLGCTLPTCSHAADRT